VKTDPHPNSGFDLLVPDTVIFTKNETVKINFEIKTEMKELLSDYRNVVYRHAPTAFYLFARSSLSKTPLMLANQVGIIDSGYRGNIIGAFRNLSSDSFVVDKSIRLVQICHPSLKPFVVEMIDDLSKTSRGEGGFGSTSGTCRISQAEYDRAVLSCL
jgi:dUTP pyrophosphatase